MKPLTSALFVVLTITAVLLLSQTTVWAQPSVAPAGWLTWHVETVDGPNAYAPSLALDSNDHPAISYGRNYSLTYALRQAGQWTKEQAADAYSVGLSQLRLDNADQPQIAFVVWSDLIHQARFTQRTTTGWTAQENPFPGAGDEISLALDQGGNAHVATCGGLFHHSGATWTEEVTNSDWRCYSPSLALDSSDRPSIAYYAPIGARIRYVYWTGSAWSTDTVDTVGSYYTYSTSPSLAVGADNRPHVTYYDANNHSLKYAVKNGTGWTTQTVDADGDVGLSSSLALDTLGNPHIAYDASGSHTIKYAVWNGTAWSISPVPATLSPYGQASYVSLALDGSDQPHIAFNGFQGIYPYIVYARGQTLPFAFFSPLVAR